MTFLNCPGIAEVTIEALDPYGNVGKNRVYADNGSGDAWTHDDLGSLAGKVNDWLTAGAGDGQKYVAFLNTEASVNKVAARDLTTELSTEYIISDSHPGLSATDSLDAGLTKAITLRTGLAGRSYRGRVFQPFLTQGFVNMGNPNTCDPDAVNNLSAAWFALKAAIESSTATPKWVVLSRVLDGAPRAEGIGTEIISTGFSDLNLDFQRRRAPGQRRHLTPPA